AADDVAYRVRTGRLHPVHRGVYAVGHPNVSREGAFLAAVLAVGPGAVLSHSAAAVLWGFWPGRHVPESHVEITVARRVKPRKNLRLHIVRSLDARDVTVRSTIPTTTPARTLLDLAD